VVSFTPRPLYPQGKSPWYQLDRRLGGLQNRSGRAGEEKNSQFLRGLESPNRPACSLVAVPLSYLGSHLSGGGDVNKVETQPGQRNSECHPS
jgi:hypothetical protein